MFADRYIKKKNTDMTLIFKYIFHFSVIARYTAIQPEMRYVDN